MKKIGVAGAGAIGSILGGYMSKGGEDVTLIEPSWMEHAQAIRQRGLIIDGCRGKHVVKVKALHASELDQLEKGSLDILFLAVKSRDTERILNLILPYLKDDARVISTQNGMNTESISSLVGNARTVGCAIMLWAALWKPGHVRETAVADVSFVIGELGSQITPHIKEIARILNLCAKTEISTNIMGHLWTKLALNCMGNGMAGITGCTADTLFRDEQVRKMYRTIAVEVITVGEASGCHLEPIWSVGAELWKHATQANIEITERVMLNMGQTRTENYSSMFQDIYKGRSTEIDWLNGYVMKRGKEAGVPTPANEVIYRLIKEIETGKLQYSPDNIGIAYQLITKGN